MEIHGYDARIWKLTRAEGGGFMVDFPQLTGCISDGETPQEAVDNAHDAVESWILTCWKHGDKVPEPNPS